MTATCAWCGTFKGVDKETDQGRMCGQCYAAYLNLQVRQKVST